MLMDRVAFGITRATGVETVSQARWYALGAEEYALSLLGRANRLEEEFGASAAAAEWLGQPIVLPIDNGVIEARIADANNCFNLNSLAGGAGADGLAFRQFVALARALDIREREAEAIAAAIADWTDGDPDTSPQGAEDYHYTNLTPPYRTANTPMVEVEELLALRNMTPALFARLRPYVCAAPETALTRLNADTLTEEDVPLVRMLFGEALTRNAARRVITDRPSGGWGNMQRFWAQQALAGVNPVEAVSGQVTLKTDYYDLMVRVTYAEAEVTLQSMLRRGNQGRVQVVSRRFGVDG
jgi:general secretion pathway protein K